MDQSRKYLQLASADIQRAAEAMEVTINELQREIDNHEADTKRKIGDLQLEITRLEAQRTTADATHAAIMTAEINKNRNEIKRLEEEHKKIHDNDKQKIKDHQQMKIDIMDQAKGLNDMIAGL